jgi:hypothetical protein
VIRLAGSGDGCWTRPWQVRHGVPGLVVGVPGLRLKRQEYRDPLVLGRVVQQQAAVLPDAVVVAEALAVA